MTSILRKPVLSPRIRSLLEPDRIQGHGAVSPFFVWRKVNIASSINVTPFQRTSSPCLAPVTKRLQHHKVESTLQASNKISCSWSSRNRVREFFSCNLRTCRQGFWSIQPHLSKAHWRIEESAETYLLQVEGRRFLRSPPIFLGGDGVFWSRSLACTINFVFNSARV